MMLGQVESRLKSSYPMMSSQHPRFIRDRAMSVSRLQLGFDSWGLCPDPV